MNETPIHINLRKEAEQRRQFKSKVDLAKLLRGEVDDED